MFNLSSYWSRKIPERGGCVSFLPNFSNEPTLLHAELYSNKFVCRTMFHACILLIHAWCGHALYLHIRCFDSQGKFTLLLKSFLIWKMVTEATCKQIEYSASLFSALLNSFFLSLPLFALNFLPLSLSLFLSTRFYSFTDNPNQLCQRTPPWSTSNRESSDL